MTPAAPEPAPVGLPRPRLSAAKQEQARLLREYHEGVARREREAEQARAAPPVVRDVRSRFRHDVAPVNEKRLGAVDGPPPPEFDPEEPAVPEGKFVSATGFAAQQANNRKRRPPTGLNLAPKKKVRVAG